MWDVLKLSNEDLNDQLKPYYDETGFLSHKKFNEFCASKGIVRIYARGEVSLKLDKDGKTPYFDLKDKVYFLQKIKHNLKAKKKDEINVDEIPF